jgi:hypothetical protein
LKKKKFRSPAFYSKKPSPVLYSIPGEGNTTGAGNVSTLSLLPSHLFPLSFFPSPLLSHPYYLLTHTFDVPVLLDSCSYIRRSTRGHIEWRKGREGRIQGKRRERTGAVGPSIGILFSSSNPSKNNGKPTLLCSNFNTNEAAAGQGISLPFYFSFFSPFFLPFLFSFLWIFLIDTYHLPRFGYFPVKRVAR